MARKREDKPYIDKGKISVEFHKYGYLAFVIENLVNVKGNNEKEVLEQIAQEWISTNRDFLYSMNITVANARAHGYLKTLDPKPFVILRGKG